MDTIEIHCSDIQKWAGCTKAMHHKTFSSDARPKRMPHIASLVGTAVHAKVSGADEPEVPASVVFDGHTPSMRIARQQVQIMSDSIKLSLRDHSDIDFEVELTSLREDHWPQNVILAGRADMVGFTPDSTIFIADLKTSHSTEHAWLQLGGYAYLMQNMGHQVDKVGVIHCPRDKVGMTSAAVDKSWVSGAEVIQESIEVVERAVSILRMNERPTAAPGPACRYCTHPSCVVRTIEPNIHI